MWSFRADPRTTRIALVGDSTVTEKSGWGRGFEAQRRGERGGAEPRPRRAQLEVLSRTKGIWDDVLRRMPTHVLLQFGHNDEPGKGLDRETDLPTFRANMAPLRRRGARDRREADPRHVAGAPHFDRRRIRRHLRGRPRAQVAREKERPADRPAREEHRS